MSTCNQQLAASENFPREVPDMQRTFKSVLVTDNSNKSTSRMRGRLVDYNFGSRLVTLQKGQVTINKSKVLIIASKCVSIVYQLYLTVL